jgi:predicted porin
VAGAVLALSASANAGIIIPAGDWTLDIGGNVNAYTTWTRTTGDQVFGSGPLGITNATGNRTENNITTGLLPNYLSVSGSTRQNDLDVAFTISINPGSSTTAPLRQTPQQENRQAFLTVGDKSWGSFKLGKDLGIFASDAILNDMTLLGVGAGAGALAGNTTTLGRIGTGYIYADWKSQIAYTTPNFNGFQATAGITQAWNATSSAAYGYYNISATSNGRNGASPAYEAKASYSFAANDVTGKIWVSGISQKVRGLSAGSSQTAWATDIGVNVNVANFGLTGYYYTGEGIGQTGQFRDGFNLQGQKRDSDGGYLQATYTLPTKTKLGVSWGESYLSPTGFETAIAGDIRDSMYVAGLYHPLTKHLNLVAEYASTEREVELVGGSTKGKSHTGSLGAILFF